MQWDKIQSEPSTKKTTNWHHERCDRRKLKIEDSIYLWNTGPAVVMKQPINFSLFLLQATVCDSGVPRKVLSLYESRGGGASLWHCVQAETSCGPRDQNPGATGAASFETFYFKANKVTKLRGLKIVCATLRKLVERLFPWVNLVVMFVFDLFSVEDKNYLSWL